MVFHLDLSTGVKVRLSVYEHVYLDILTIRYSSVLSVLGLVVKTVVFVVVIVLYN